MSMTLTHTLCPPFVDADRRGGSSGGGRVSARVWIVLAYVVLVAAWAVARANGYWR
jgi:hypothetical protein